MPPFPAKPLQGRGIVVTRPTIQAARLATLVTEAGGRPIVFPAIEIEDVPERALPALQAFDLVIFASPSAVAMALKRSVEWSANTQVAGIGGGTRRALELAGFPSVLTPASGADSEALLALPALQQARGQRVLIIRGEGGRDLLERSLIARGAEVTCAELYRRVASRASVRPLLDAWSRGEVDAVTVFSSQALDHFIERLGAEGAERLRATPLFATHARIAEHAQERGSRHVVVCGATDDELLARLVAYFGAQ